MIVELDKKKLEEIFEKTVDPNLLYEEIDNDHDVDSGSINDHAHIHDHIGPIQP